MTVKVLDNKQVDYKIKRLAYEIYENNAYEKELYVLGINTNGYNLAKLIVKELTKICDIQPNLSRLKIDPSSPVENDISLEIDIEQLKNKSIIIIDDVANTGRTIYYSFRPLLNILTKKIEIAVLVDRQHKNFPVKVDYVGLSLATTHQENIDVILKSRQKTVVLN